MNELNYIYKKLFDKIKYKPKMTYDEFVKECAYLRLTRKEIYYILKELQNSGVLEFNKKQIRIKRF